MIPTTETLLKGLAAFAIGMLAVVCVTLIGRSHSSDPQPEWTPLAPEYVETVYETTNGVRDCYFRSFFPKPIPEDADGTSMLLPRFMIDPGSTVQHQRGE